MNEVALLLAIALIAFLYASVGHGGASGYLVVLAILGYGQEVMRPSALCMNLVVSGVSFALFTHGGHFRWKLFWPFALTSVPFAFLGAGILIDPTLYKRILAVCLLFAVARLLGLWGSRTGERSLNVAAALIIGAVLGLVSGMIGIGGGILLSPVLLLLGWASVKETAAVSALFIFVNSLSGLARTVLDGAIFDEAMIGWMIAAMAGGLLGGHVGAQRLNDPRLRQVLGIILLFAAVKLFWV